MHSSNSTGAMFWPPRIRIVTIGQLVLFSTKTGDAWLLDPADQLAARLARDGESEPIQIEETDTTFAIGWKGRYRIEGPALRYGSRRNSRIPTISCAPLSHRLARAFWALRKRDWRMRTASLARSRPPRSLTRNAVKR
jgi:hypothetical protein